MTCKTCTTTGICLRKLMTDDIIKTLFKCRMNTSFKKCLYIYAVSKKILPSCSILNFQDFNLLVVIF
jgi:hypothetical protein